MTNPVGDTPAETPGGRPKVEIVIGRCDCLVCRLQDAMVRRLVDARARELDRQIVGPADAR